MGYIKHHTIVVTTWDKDRCKSLHGLVPKKLPVTPVVEGVINGQHSFCIVPDGSKEGWQESDDCDEARDKLIRLIRTFDYEDGSNPFCWVEVAFPGDDDEAEVLGHTRKDGSL